MKHPSFLNAMIFTKSLLSVSLGFISVFFVKYHLIPKSDAPLNNKYVFLTLTIGLLVSGIITLISLRSDRIITLFGLYLQWFFYVFITFTTVKAGLVAGTSALSGIAIFTFLALAFLLTAYYKTVEDTTK